MNSRQKQFVQAMKDFKNQLNFESLMVADSALYTQENVQLLTDIKWLSRVPVRSSSQASSRNRWV